MEYSYTIELFEDLDQHPRWHVVEWTSAAEWNGRSSGTTLFAVRDTGPASKREAECWLQEFLAAAERLTFLTVRATIAPYTRRKETNDYQV